MIASSAGDVIGVLDLVVSVSSLVVGTAVTVILHRLSRRLNFRTRMHTRDELRRVVRTFAKQMHDEQLNTDVLLLNADRYERDYDGGNRFTRHGWVQIRTEYIDVHHDSIALLSRAVASWWDSSGRRVLHDTGTPAGTVLQVGHIPFHWVEHIEPDGNDFTNAPLVYTRFLGRARSPFQRYTFHEAESVPMGPRGRPYYAPIAELSTLWPSRISGVRGFWLQWWRDLGQRRDARRHASAQGPRP